MSDTRVWPAASDFGSPPFILAVLVVAAAYFGFAEIGFSLAYATKQVTAVWVPSGIALAALLLGGYRLWPGIWLGAFAANALEHEPLLTAAGVAIGNSAAPLVGAVLVRRVADFDNALQRLRDVFALVALGALGAMTISATNGTLNLLVARIVSWPHAGSVWSLWWAGDAMGVLIVTPLVLTWFGRRGEKRADGSLGEFAALCAVTIAIALLAFAGNSTLPVTLRHSSFVYPCVIWAALRFRQRETTTIIAIVSAIAIWAAAHGFYSPNIGSDIRLASLMTFLAILSITGMVLSAATAERRSVRAQLNSALRKTTHVAQTLQEALLPVKLPSHHRMAFDAFYVTAREETLIGGDWYDAFELPDGSVAISIGDVSGHGVEAAVTAERIRQAIFAAATDLRDPAAILSKADRTLQFQDGGLATALVAIVDPEKREMRYASAGHPPPILAAPSTAPRLLPTGGIPLGIAKPIHPNVETRTRAVALEAGAFLLFYTDGLTEFRHDAESAERLLLESVSIVAADDSTPRPAAALHRAVVGDASPRDDTVLLTVRVR